MSSARAGTPGATRVCPHCKAVVLETAAVCPGCRHHLRFSTDAQLAPADGGYSAFNLEGTIAHRKTGEHCEYCIVLDVRNERGEQIIRQVVGVGALHPGELRRLNLAVEMLPVRAAGSPKPETAAAASTRDGRASLTPATPARAPSPALAASPAAPARAPASALVQPAAAAAPAAPSVAAAPAKPAPAAAGSAVKSAPARGADSQSQLPKQLGIFRKP